MISLQRRFSVNIFFLHRIKSLSVEAIKKIYKQKWGKVET